MSQADLLQGQVWQGGVFYDQLPAELFPLECGPEDFVRVLVRLNGHFRIIIERGDYILAAVDRVRSLPLFFAEQNNQLLIGPDAFELRSSLGKPALDENALPEFLLVGYTCLNNTLFKEIKQLEAGQYLIWHKPTATLRIKDYYRYQHVFGEPEPSLEQLDRMLENIILRLAESAQDRTLVIPLSGGYDSRQIAVMLKRIGYPKVVCFTYGSRLHGECATSRKVAKFLNFPWHMVEQNRLMWYKAFQSEEMRSYFRFSTHLCSSPHVQDWLAVQKLKESGLIPDDAIIVPGYSGDFPQGTKLPQVFGNKAELANHELLEAIYRQHYDLWHCSNDRLNAMFAERIKSYLQIPELVKAEIAASLFDEWDWRQRQAKFIVNCVRVYEFFGYDWRLPFFDREYLDLWSRVPLKLRIGRGFYLQYLAKYQTVPVPAYHGKPLPQRLRDKYVRMQAGNIMDPVYGRILDYRNRHDYLNTRVSSLFAPNLNYPDFVNQNLTILSAKINGIQALYYLRELLSGRLD